MISQRSKDSQDAKRVSGKVSFLSAPEIESIDTDEDKAPPKSAIFNVADKSRHGGRFQKNNKEKPSDDIYSATNFLP